MTTEKDPYNMVTKEKVLEEKDFLTGQLSVQIRNVSLGLLLAVWGLLTQNVIKSKELIAIGFFAFIALFFDYLQYFFGFWNNKLLIKQMEDESVDKSQYDYKSWTYRLRAFFFCGKHVAFLIAVFWFLSIIIRFLLSKGTLG